MRRIGAEYIDVCAICAQKNPVIAGFFFVRHS
jgi:hypothetical protein